MRRARSELKEWLEEARSTRLDNTCSRSYEDAARQWLI